jgi:hypothetical protein
MISELNNYFIKGIKTHRKCPICESVMDIDYFIEHCKDVDLPIEERKLWENPIIAIPCCKCFCRIKRILMIQSIYKQNKISNDTNNKPHIFSKYRILTKNEAIDDCLDDYRKDVKEMIKKNLKKYKIIED